MLWWHFSGRSTIPLVKTSGSLGWAGVEIFFVVSGFVIPYAMHRAGYVFPRDAKRFLARRLVRLDPPYLVASGGAALLAYVAWKTQGGLGPIPHFSWAAALAHVGYLNGVLGLPWFNGVCWTLGIEFQFYLAAAILFPLFVGPAQKFLFLAIPTSVLTLALVKFGILENHRFSPWLLKWAPLYIMGISSFRLHGGLASKREFICVILVAAIVAGLIGPRAGVLAGAVSAIFLTFGTVARPRFVAVYAGITYSLYLVHDPIGALVMRLSHRVGHSVTVQIVALVLSVAISMFVAIVFWRFVELPSLQWAARIKANHNGGGWRKTETL